MVERRFAIAAEFVSITRPVVSSSPVLKITAFCIMSVPNPVIAKVAAGRSECTTRFSHRPEALLKSSRSIETSCRGGGLQPDDSLPASLSANLSCVYFRTMTAMREDLNCAQVETQVL